MALIDAAHHSSTRKGTPSWQRSKRRRESKGHRSAWKAWLRRVRGNPDLAEGESPPPLPDVPTRGRVQGRSIERWIVGTVLNQGDVGVAGLRSTVRKAVGWPLWSRWIRRAFERAVEHAVERGRVARMGTALAAPGFYNYNSQRNSCLP